MAGFKNWFEKDMAVWLFYIRIKQLHVVIVFYGCGKAGRHHGLSGSPLAASNRNNHFSSPAVL
jgi:hypothetical protein